MAVEGENRFVNTPKEDQGMEWTRLRTIGMKNQKRKSRLTFNNNNNGQGSFIVRGFKLNHGKCPNIN